MNRIIIKASVMVLLVLAVSLGVKAQNVEYRAEIPFSFQAAGKHYEAGKYSVGSLSQVSSPGGIVIRDLQNRNGRILGMNSAHGDNNWDKPGTLTFLKVEGEYRLSQISTPTFKMEMKGRAGKGRELAQRAPSGSNIVTIALNK